MGAALPLDGIVVVAIKQAVAAPFCTSRLADAGATVLTLDEARAYRPVPGLGDHDGIYRGHREGATR